MPVVENLLTQFDAQLQRALADADWADIARLDQGIRSCLERLPATHELSAPSRAARQRLKRRHGLAMAACVAERERLRRLLERQRDQAEAQLAYRSIDLYRDEE
ncbi:hypothetical protein SFA35_01325 [Pseudomonas sp. HR96]|uniref:hypothetical protein n=1 Tax=Pseudomonas sp. HR96 TaxID=1027966 RepID=UPI002A756F69|nr:hypothetical protein [Pseudomonas sp. HR96]WPP00058.1 hypothetical protein SFA35_01325 [Pseudomonas sp. HR96]